MANPPKSLFVAFFGDGTTAGVARSRKGLRRWLGSCFWSDEERADVTIERYVAASRPRASDQVKLLQGHRGGAESVDRGGGVIPAINAHVARETKRLGGC